MAVPGGTRTLVPNFLASHRDQYYSPCCTNKGKPTSVSLWLPCNVNGATAENEAMRVLPCAADNISSSPVIPSGCGWVQASMWLARPRQWPPQPARLAMHAFEAHLLENVLKKREIREGKTRAHAVSHGGGRDKSLCCVS
jgi:hypothetical protein